MNCNVVNAVNYTKLRQLGVNVGMPSSEAIDAKNRMGPDNLIVLIKLQLVNSALTVTHFEVLTSVVLKTLVSVIKVIA